MTRVRPAILGVLALAVTFACESPVTPATCGDPGSIRTFPEYRNQREVCVDGAAEGATYTATSSDTRVASVATDGTTLLVTGHDLGETRITVTATNSDGTTATTVYPIVTVFPVTSDFTCSIGPSDDPDYNEVVYEGYVTAHVDLSEVHYRHTVGDDWWVQVSRGPYEAGRTYNLYGTGLVSTEVDGDECSVDVVGYTY